MKYAHRYGNMIDLKHSLASKKKTLLNYNINFCVHIFKINIILLKKYINILKCLVHT